MVANQVANHISKFRPQVVVVLAGYQYEGKLMPPGDGEQQSLSDPPAAEREKPRQLRRLRDHVEVPKKRREYRSPIQQYAPRHQLLRSAARRPIALLRGTSNRRLNLAAWEVALSGQELDGVN